jgi:hypothetical protein
MVAIGVKRHGLFRWLSAVATLRDMSSAMKAERKRSVKDDGIGLSKLPLDISLPSFTISRGYAGSPSGGSIVQVLRNA